MQENFRKCLLAVARTKVCFHGNHAVSLQSDNIHPMSGRRIKVVLMTTASEFISSLPDKAQKKITYNLLKVEGGETDKNLFKKLENSNIWEFRTLFNGICYRLFAFWDTEKDAFVVATHGIVKKTQKTPKKEIEKAEKLMEEYFNDKNK